MSGGVTADPRNIIDKLTLKLPDPMIHTLPSAELPNLAARFAPGERSWSWIELGLSIPYFLASQLAVTSEGEVVRDFLIARLDQLLSLAAQDTPERQLLGVGLLSPGYMNGTEQYQLGAVKTIWRSRSNKLKQRFDMQDGTQLVFDITNDQQSDDMEVVLAF